MAGARGERAVLAPAGHPPVDQRRVARQAVGGAEAEPLGHAGAVPLDQHVGAGRQPEHHLGAARVLEVDDDAPLPRLSTSCRAATGDRRAAGPVDPDHLGAEVGEQHPGERPGPDPGQLDHPHPGQRPGIFVTATSWLILATL